MTRIDIKDDDLAGGNPDIGVGGSRFMRPSSLVALVEDSLRREPAVWMFRRVGVV